MIPDAMENHPNGADEAEGHRESQKLIVNIVQKERLNFVEKMKNMRYWVIYIAF